MNAADRSGLHAVRRELRTGRARRPGAGADADAAPAGAGERAERPAAERFAARVGLAAARRELAGARAGGSPR